MGTGKSWLGRFKSRTGAVLLVLEEEDGNSVVERLNVLYGAVGLSEGEGDALPIEYLIQQGVNLLTPDGALNPDLVRHVQEMQPALIVLDPFRRVHGLGNTHAKESHLEAETRT